MENKKAIPSWVGIVTLILIVLGSAWAVYSIFTAVPPDGNVLESQIIHAMTIFVMYVAFFYVVTGFKKTSALFFQVTLALYTIVTFVTALLVRNSEIVILPVCSILSFGILCILTVAKDVGKQISYLLAGINVVLAVLRMIVYAAMTGQLPGGMVGNLILAMILGLMMYAKYTDKAARHTA